MPRLTLLTLFAFGLVLTSCNTVAGVGRDVSAAGKAVSRTAQEAKR